MTLELERIQRNQKAELISGNVKKYYSSSGRTTTVGQNWTKMKARGKIIWSKNSGCSIIKT